MLLFRMKSRDTILGGGESDRNGSYSERITLITYTTAMTIILYCILKYIYDEYRISSTPIIFSEYIHVITIV